MNGELVKLRVIQRIMEGTFNYEGNKGEAIHVNIPEDMQGLCANVECVMLEAKTGVNKNKFAGGEEFDLYAEPWVEPEQQEATPFLLKSSDLTLAGDPVMEDSTAVINKQEKTGKKPGKPGAGLPQTGDDSMLPIAACGVAGVALVATALVIRKRR